VALSTPLESILLPKWDAPDFAELKAYFYAELKTTN